MKNKMDLFGVLILGCTTSVGGGVLRDILIGKGIPSLFENPSYVFVAAITTFLVFNIFYFFKNRIIVRKTYQLVYHFLDSLGLGVFVVVGVSLTINFGITNHFLIIFASVLTAVGGGVLRDLLSAHIPIVFQKQIYCIIAIFAAMFYYFMILYTNFISLAALLTILFVVGARYLAFRWDLNLPKVKFNEE